MHVVAVTGGRFYNNRGHIYQVLTDLHQQQPITLLVHGACHVNNRLNADFLAEDWACFTQIPYLGIPANSNHFGWPMAGPTRNAAMLHDYGVDTLVAFPGGSGTNGCVNIARAMNREAGHVVIVIVDEREYRA
jgi:hypothetical protein